MAVDFPASPTAGQVFISGTTRYVYNAAIGVWRAGPILTAYPFNFVFNPTFTISNQSGDATQTVSGTYICDGWWFGCGGAVVPTWGRANVRTPGGSPYRMRCTITTPDPTLTTTDHTHLMHRMEAARFAPIYWTGTAGSGYPIVVRFGFKGPAGTYSFNIRTSNATPYAWVGVFTITAAQANTDTVQVFAIPAPNGGTWLNPYTDNYTFAVQFSIGLAFGPDYTSSVLGWQSGPMYSHTSATNGIAVAGAVYEIFDVGLYIDPLATGRAPPFACVPDRVAWQDSLRYWQKDFGAVGIGMGAQPSFQRCSYMMSANMNAAPAVALVGTMRSWDQGTAPNLTSVYQNFCNKQVSEYNWNESSAMIAGRGAVLIDTQPAIYIAQSSRL